MSLNFIKAGVIIKTHGYKGDIVLKKENSISNSLFEECLEEGNAIFVEKDGIPVPFFISENSLYFFDDDIARLQLDDIDSDIKARAFISENVYFTQNCKEDIINELSPNNWIGFKVNDENNGYLGTVLDFSTEIPQNPLIIVEKEQKTLMIPLQDDFIIAVFVEKQEIITRLPEGFINLYS